MCEPTTIMMIGIGASAATSTAANYAAGNAAMDEAAANRDLAKARAVHTEKLGAMAGAEAREEGTQAAATQRAQMAEDNLEITSGTAVNVFAATAGEAEKEAKTLEYNAALEAWGHRKEAAAYEVQRKNARRSRNLGVLSGILGGAAQGTAAYRTKP